MVFSAPQSESYLKDSKVPTNFWTQNLLYQTLFSFDITHVSDGETLITIYIQDIALFDNDVD